MVGATGTAEGVRRGDMIGTGGVQTLVGIDLAWRAHHCRSYATPGSTRNGAGKQRAACISFGSGGYAREPLYISFMPARALLMTASSPPVRDRGCAENQWYYV